MEKVNIVKMGINGEGIGYLNKKPIFVSGALPKEYVDVYVTEENPTYAKGTASHIIEASKDRISPQCKHQKECGGCALGILNYKSQCYYKKSLLTEALYKYAHIRKELVREVHTNRVTKGYRNQCKMPVQESHHRLTCGLYEAGTNHFKPMDKCLVQDKQLEEVRSNILKVLNKAHFPAYDARKMKGLRYLVIRTIDNQSQCTLITGKDTLSEKLIEDIYAIDSVQSVFQSINTQRKGVDIFGSKVRLLKGEETLKTTWDDFSISLSPRSFLQLNTEMAKELYSMVISKVDPCETLVEAYCGIGLMSLLASKKAQHVIGIESIPEAIENAKVIAEENHIENVEYLLDDAAEGLQKVLQKTNVNTLLVDPPRSGMDDAMLETILSSSIEKIIYVSCNPATLARNLKVLKKNYQVLTIIPYDLFPNTPHIESITVLSRNGVKSGKKAKKYEIPVTE